MNKRNIIHIQEKIVMILTLANGSKFDTNLKSVIEKTTPIKKKNINGVVLYKGESVLDGSPIVVLAKTSSTTNEKTGNMIQTYILRDDIHPMEAIKTKKDSSVCGNCPHRRSLGGACYVVPTGTGSIYKSYKNGKYATYSNELHSHLFNERSIRIGTYGDPAAVPFEVWKNILKFTKNHTGYTHQLGHKNFDKRIAEICMVSCDTENQAKKAQKQGFKTFRVKTENMPNLQSEIDCIFDINNTKCIDCGLCDGKTVNIVINVHGRLQNRFKNKFEVIKTVNL